MADESLVERRKDDRQFQDAIVARVSALEESHTEIKRMISVNNEMTETILSIIEGTRKFWNFCLKLSRGLIWTAKKGTIIAVAVTAAYHALDAVASHDIGAMFTKWWKR